RFMRRYFDEYRGLRRSVGHVEPLGARRVAGRALAEARADSRFMRSKGLGPGERFAWTLRSARHHAGRAVFAGLGSRAEPLPAAVQSRLSLERSGGSPAASSPAPFPRIEAVSSHQFESIV